MRGLNNFENNYNKAWDVFTSEEKAPALHMAHKALSTAQKIVGAPNIERELIEALVHRYPKSADSDPITSSGISKSLQVWIPSLPGM